MSKEGRGVMAGFVNAYLCNDESIWLARWEDFVSDYVFHCFDFSNPNALLNHLDTNGCDQGPNLWIIDRFYDGVELDELILKKLMNYRRGEDRVIGASVTYFNWKSEYFDIKMSPKLTQFNQLVTKSAH